MTSKLDGIGLEKMKTLDEALVAVQKLHGIIEHLALASRTQQPTSSYLGQFRRGAAPLVNRLKGQFSLISDQLAAILLVATRSGSDQAKVRSMREGIAQVRMQLEVAINKVKEQHSAEKEQHSTNE